jgi:hypothetical protein
VNQISFLPEISPTWFCNLYNSTGILSLMIATTDEFANSYAFSLTVPSSQSSIVDSCSSLSATMTVKDIVAYPNSFLIFANAGVFIGNTTSATNSWTSILSNCIGSMTKKTQNPPFLLALGQTLGEFGCIKMSFQARVSF